VTKTIKEPIRDLREVNIKTITFNAKL